LPNAFGIQKALVIQPAFIGDAMLSTVVPQALRHEWPDVEVHHLVRSGNQSLLEGHPDIHQVWVWEKQSRKYRHLLALGRQLRRERFDLVVNLHRFLTSGLLTALSGARYQVGFAKNPLAWSFTHALPHPITTERGQAFVHETERYLSLLAPFFTPKPQRPTLYLTDKERQAVAPYTQEGFVVMAPASVWFTKQWPEAHWCTLTAKLGEALKVYVIGAPNEVALCERVASAHPQAVSLAGKLNLRESAALLAASRWVISNDSAPQHLASAVAAPVTTVYCSTLPEFGFGPTSPQASVAELATPLPCRPCGLHGKSACPEGHFKCGLNLQPDEVWAKAPPEVWAP